MIKPHIKYIFLISVIVVSVLIGLNIINAASCWSYSTSVTCAGNSSCNWKNDSWGGWCEEKNCWSYWAQDDCTGADIFGKNCSWSGGSTNSYCTEVSCYTFDGTNQSACEQNNKSLNCE